MPDETTTDEADMSRWAKRVVDRLGPNCVAGLILKRAEQLRAEGRRAVVFFRMPTGWQVGVDLAGERNSPRKHARVNPG